MSPPTDTRPFVAARDGQAVPWNDTSVIRLHFVIAQFFKRGQWLIVRPGTSGVMLTTDIGRQALKLFRKGASPADVKHTLASAAGLRPEQVVLDPIIGAAGRAGLVKSIDGIVVRAPEVDPRRLALHLLKLLTYPLTSAAIDRCPMAIRERLLFHLQWFFEGRFRYECDKGSTLANLQRLFPERPASWLEAHTRDYHTQRVRSDLGFRTTGKGLKRVFRWLDVFVGEDVDGGAGFRRCLDAGTGVVVVTFHFGCYWLMPAALLRMGLRVHALVASISERERLVEREVVPGFPRAKLKFYDSNPRGFVDLARALREGDVVLLFADTHGLGGTALQRFVHQSWGKAALSRSPAVLRGFPFPVEATVGWLHRHSGAPIVPAVLYPMARSWRVRLEFGRPVEAAGGGPLTEEAVTRAVYGQLEDWITRLPEHWAYLNSFPGKPVDPRASLSA